VLLLGMLLPNRRRWIVGSLIAYLAGPLVFANLHIIHDYYAYANGLFLIAAAGWVLIGLLERGGGFRVLAVALLSLIIVFQQREYQSGYRLQQMDAAFRNVPQLPIELRQLVPKDRILLVYGLAWDPTISYYSERRALMDMLNRPLDRPPISESLRILRESGLSVGAMLACAQPWEAGIPLPDIHAAVATFHLSAQPAYQDQQCKLYLPIPG